MPTVTKAIWPGIQQTAGFSFTLQPGVRPSVCVLRSPPTSAAIVDRGTLTLQQTGDSGDQSIEFTDCAVDRPSLSRDGNGFEWAIPIYDRRWRWQFSAISGDYNREEANGTLTREKTPRELAKLLFAAMGEATSEGNDNAGPDVSRLPNDTRPRKRWTHANAANELDALCAELGCLVVLNPITNRAEIWPEGQGRPLPNLPGQGQGFELTARLAPKTIRVVAQPTLYEATFTLGEAVGREVDGTWQPIGDLSYEPPGSWAFESVNFSNVTGVYTDNGVTIPRRNLAEQTVWRAYRITGMRGKPKGDFASLVESVGGEGPLGFADIVLESTRVVSVTDTGGGQTRLSHRILARRWQTEGELEVYPGGSSIIAADGVVTFSEPILDVADPLEVVPRLRQSEAYLTTGFRAGSEGVLNAETVDVDAAPSGFGVLVVRANELQRRIVFDANNAQVIADNREQLVERAEAIAAAELAKFAPFPSQTVDYDGIVPIVPDGVIRQVAWSGGGGSPSRTIVGVGREVDARAPSLERQRRERRAEQAAEAANRQIEVLTNPNRLEELIDTGVVA